MRALVWCLGVLQILAGIMLSHNAAPAWGWVWVGAVIVWLFAGAVLVAMSLVRLAGKAGGVGQLTRTRAGTGAAPPPRKDE